MSISPFSAFPTGAEDRPPSALALGLVACGSVPKGRGLGPRGVAAGTAVSRTTSFRRYRPGLSSGKAQRRSTHRVSRRCNLGAGCCRCISANPGARSRCSMAGERPGLVAPCRGTAPLHMLLTKHPELYMLSGWQQLTYSCACLKVHAFSAAPRRGATLRADCLISDTILSHT